MRRESRCVGCQAPTIGTDYLLSRSDLQDDRTKVCMTCLDAVLAEGGVRTGAQLMDAVRDKWGKKRVARTPAQREQLKTVTRVATLEKANASLESKMDRVLQLLEEKS